MNYEETKVKVLELIKENGLTDNEINLLAKELEIYALEFAINPRKIELIVADFFSKVSTRLAAGK